MGKLQSNAVLVYVEPEVKHSLALQEAIELMEGGGGTITLATAVHAWPAFLLPEHFVNAYTEDVAQALEKLAVKYDARGTRIETLILKGRPDLAIVRQVHECGHDLLMKDAEGSTNEKEYSSAGLDVRLLRKCRCPIWLNRPRGTDTGIGVAIAPETEPEGIEFNKRLVDVAISLGEKMSQSVHIIQAWEMMGQIYLARRTSPAEYERFMKTYQEKVEKSLFDFLEPFGFAKGSDRVHLVHGLPELVVGSTVKDRSLGLLVIGTVARVGLAGHLLGNTAEQVARSVECSVLTIEPDH